ncbi:TonB-dependent siderophore receptor [Paraflavitalea speifideaquila]|uniref:TonB-dependent siderophore receptor n=1 Tax=Paraflavitalea speifideaquila TaxID=3076558 RepID=UPI0028E5034B|nr:TonB-dependent receptor [Paraflavitalea speifideiaquila]
MPIADTLGNSKGTRSFRPEHADQLEFGVKTNLFANKLSATLSFYNIKVSDRVTVDPLNRNDYKQGGKVESKGVELDLRAFPMAGLSIIAGYSYNDIKVKAGNKNDFYAEVGSAPGGQGPPNLANLWANYKFQSGKLKNFGIGVGGNYASQYKVINNTTTGDFFLPSYTLINAGISYNAEKFSIGCNVNNLTNEVYYIGYWSVNPPASSQLCGQLFLSVLTNTFP